MVQLVKILDGNWVPISYQVLSTLTAATALTVPTDAEAALIQVYTKNARWLDCGATAGGAITPTESLGMQLIAGDTPLFYIGDLTTFKLIEETASATGLVVYYRKKQAQP